MDDNQNSNIVRTLVDALSKSLQYLSEKINTMNPVLNNVNSNVDKQVTEINKILFEIQSISKLLDTVTSDFYDRSNKIIEIVNTIKTKIEQLSQIESTLEKYNTESKEYINNVNAAFSSLSNSINELKTTIEPVVKLSNWITKPIGIIIFIIGMIFASITIINGVRSVVEYFHTTTQVINNQSNLSNDSNK